LETPLSFPGLLLYPILVVFGVLIHYALMLMLMCLSFWTTRAQGFINAYYSVFQIARLPRQVFFGPVSLVFTWVLPVLLVANVPAQMLISGLAWADLLAMAGVTGLFLMLSRLVFLAGLRRYGSASS
jgi:ABC-2 type transport system permease protein